MENKETPEVKLGSDDMRFWADIVQNLEKQLETAAKNVKYVKACLEMAEEKYKKAQAEFNKE